MVLVHLFQAQDWEVWQKSKVSQKTPKNEQSVTTHFKAP